MTQYIADEAHFKEVITRVPKVKRSLWIGTAVPGPAGQPDQERQGGSTDSRQGSRTKLPGGLCHYPVLFTGLERALCPRVHFKIIIFDLQTAYIGAANLTGAGIGMKSARKKFCGDPIIKGSDL